MDQKLYQAYIDILKEELLPAMGCTEPIAVAYAAAVAARELKAMPEAVEIRVSGNIIKNVKSVVVPNTGGLRGLGAAAAAGIVARIVHLNVRCDGVQAMEFGGDGLILATPTGSTAYSLSAGGPIVEPDARNILITPICAHDVMTKCIVASDKRVIDVQLASTARRNAFLSVDGGRAVKLNMGDVATVCCSRMETKLIRLKERSFYDVVSNKFKQ